MLHEYHIIYSGRYYLQFHVTTVCLKTYYPRYGGPPVFDDTFDRVNFLNKTPAEWFVI